MNNFHELPEANTKKFISWKLKDKKTMRGVFSFKEHRDLTIEFTSITLASNVDASISEWNKNPANTFISLLLKWPKMFKFWTILTIQLKFPRPPTKFWTINWPTDSDQECKRKMIPKKSKISTWKMIPIAQFALQRWTKTLKHCKDAKHAKNISILNAFQPGKSTMQHVHYAEASSLLALVIQTTLWVSFKEFILKHHKMKINDFHLSIIFYSLD